VQTNLLKLPLDGVKASLLALQLLSVRGGVGERKRGREDLQEGGACPVFGPRMTYLFLAAFQGNRAVEWEKCNLFLLVQVRNILPMCAVLKTRRAWAWAWAWFFVVDET